MTDKNRPAGRPCAAEAAERMRRQGENVALMCFVAMLLWLSIVAVVLVSP